MSVTNLVHITGRLAKRPELKSTQSGKFVCSISIAVKGYNRTDWIDIVAWEKTAEFICNHFDKGQLIVVFGELQTRTWRDSGSNNHKVTEVVVREVGFAGDKHANLDNCKNRDAFEDINPDDELPF